MDARDLLFDGIEACAGALAQGAASSVELVTESLERIERVEPHLNAFRAVWADEALACAAAADTARLGGDTRPLLGVPLALKDDLDVAGKVTGNGSRACTEAAATDAEAIARLRRAGMVLVGKTNLPEFGQWACTESDLHGVTRNPWDLHRTPGGSSGGSAAAVAAGLVPAAMGSDGGGSIRIPAACCGLFGLKTSRGRVSTAPAPDSWDGLGVVGPLTRNVVDSAIVNDVIRGNVASDRFRCADPAMPFEDAARTEPGCLRVALVSEPSIRGVPVAPECVAAAGAIAGLLEDLGHHVDVVSHRWPDPLTAFVTRSARGVYAESMAGARPELVEDRTKTYNRLHSLVPRPLVEWVARTSAGVGAEANRIFERFDVVLTPALGSLPVAAGSLGRAGLLRASRGSMWAIPYTTLWNVAGNPAAALPAGLSSEGIPLSVQIVTPIEDECTLLSLAAQVERARPWSALRPDEALWASKVPVPDGGAAR